MHPLFFDLIIIVLFFVSVALGFMRGFVNEVFTIFGWIGAVLATIYFTPVAGPFMEQFITKPWLAKLAAAALIFIITMAVFSAVSHITTKSIHYSQLGIVDRGLGFAFGILRAIVLFGLGYLLFAYVFSDAASRPDFIKRANTKPFLEASAAWIQAILPGDNDIDVSGTAKPSAEKEKKELEEKRKLDEAIEERMEKVSRGKDNLVDDGKDIMNDKK